MTQTLLLLAIALLLVNIALLLALLRRRAPDPNLAPVQSRLDLLEKGQERVDRSLRGEIARNREESGAHARDLREEVGASFSRVGGSLIQNLGEMSLVQKERLDTLFQALGQLTETHERKLDGLRTTVETRLGEIREDNTRQLEQMRQTVDEKLQGALEQRLGESFRLVSERLEQVHRGLGEMQTLAHGVGDLKRVLSNVKVRGTWGEVQLGSILEQVLTQEQYATNVATRPGGGERVEFAIKLPGRGDHQGDVVWLPIDAKFPLEDYQRLVDAQERADPAAMEAAARQLELRVRACAREICDKYLNPPQTTDFAILFLPTEGLYAEIIRRAGLIEVIQRECRVIVAGPTTLAALLNSLQMGFRTLAVQKRSSEVWATLGGVKTEFGKFGVVLDKVHKKLQEATNVVEDAARRKRAVERKLRGVEADPCASSGELLDEGLVIGSLPE